MSDRFSFALALSLALVSLMPSAFAANKNNTIRTNTIRTNTIRTNTIRTNTNRTNNTNKPVITYQFGSSQYIQQWNKNFETQQKMLNGAAAVTPQYGYAPHVPSAVLKGGSNQCGDYLAEELSHGAMRWNHAPLRVYIGEGGGGYQRSYGPIFRASLNEWTKATNGRISFVPVNNPSQSDIDVDWIPGTPGVNEAGNTQSAFANVYGHRVLTHAHIDLAGIVRGKPMSNSEMHKTCLHELGHALGLVHTSGRGDIMFWQSNPKQACALGPRDCATIQRLYSIQ